VEVGTVEGGNETYSVTSYATADGEICLEATYEAGQPPHLACGPAPDAKNPVGPVVVGDTPDGSTLVYGASADAVASVDVLVPGANAKTLRPKAQARAGHVFIAKVPKVKGLRIVGRSGNGKVLRRVGGRNGDG
jgi:hypothetical protein